MHEQLNDPVDVLVDFAQNRVIPKQMSWNKREYDLKRLHLVHATHEGEKRVYFFAVSDETNYFKLRLDPDRLEWRLVELYTP